MADVICQYRVVLTNRYLKNKQHPFPRFTFTGYVAVQFLFNEVVYNMQSKAGSQAKSAASGFIRNLQACFHQSSSFPLSTSLKLLLPSSVK